MGAKPLCSSVYADVVIERAGMLLALLWLHILKEQKLIDSGISSGKKYHYRWIYWMKIF